jgi:putative Mn2+ efflux pump MntP|tara:strand:+ start:2466 stop:2618 length:153 start_codon:yes stop_codon:yes gene_type:complete
MLDDLIIFSLAAFAVNTTLGTKYARHCKIIGGIILLILGLVLIFAPHLLS